jgi:hypothetical protein
MINSRHLTITPNPNLTFFENLFSHSKQILNPLYNNTSSSPGPGPSLEGPPELGPGDEDDNNIVLYMHINKLGAWAPVNITQIPADISRGLLPCISDRSFNLVT